MESHASASPGICLSSCEVMKGLTQREADILSFRRNGKTYREIGEFYKISHERARQVYFAYKQKTFDDEKYRN